MGNCICKKVRPDEEDHQDLKFSAMVAGKISFQMSPAPPLKSGEVLRVNPQSQQHSLQVADSCNGQKVKIVVTKKQLQLLMRSVEELKLRHIVIQKIGKKGKKWRPSIATIPEL